MIKLNELNGLSKNEAMGKIYYDFLNYGKNKSKYLAGKYGLNDEECTLYIASGMYNQFMNYYEKIENKNDNNIMIDCLIHVYATLKTIINNMNFADYENIRSSKTITVIDVLKQWENRDSRSENKYNVYFEDDKTLQNKLHSNYGNPESDYLRQEAKNTLHELSQKIKNHKKYNELLFILNKEKQDKKDENFLCYFKKSNNIKCSSTELLELVANY